MKKSKHLITTLAFLGVFAVALCVWAWAAHKTAPTKPQAPDVSSAAFAKSPAEPMEKKLVSSYQEPYTLEQLTQDASLVVRGTVTGGEVLTVSGVRGGTALITEYQVSVSQVLRGELDEDEKSIAIQRVGDPQSDTVVYVDEPELEKGREYLLFLQKSEIGGDFNIAGGHYVFLGGKQGVYEWARDAQIAGAAPEQMISQNALAALEASPAALSESKPADSAVAMSDLESQITQVNQETPPNPSLHDDALRDALNTNVETGFLTEEEREQILEEIEQYATVKERRALW